MDSMLSGPGSKPHDIKKGSRIISDRRPCRELLSSWGAHNKITTQTKEHFVETMVFDIPQVSVVLRFGHNTGRSNTGKYVTPKWVNTLHSWRGEFDHSMLLAGWQMWSNRYCPPPQLVVGALQRPAIWGQFVSRFHSETVLQNREQMPRILKPRFQNKSVGEDYCVAGCDAVLTDIKVRTFRTNFLPPFSSTELQAAGSFKTFEHFC